MSLQLSLSAAGSMASTGRWCSVARLGGLSETSVGTSIKKAEPGWHFCQFHRDDSQLLSMVAPFVAEGLKNGEEASGCCRRYLISDASSVSLGANRFTNAAMVVTSSAGSIGFAR